MSRVYIVIPSYNHWNLTHALLWSLQKQERKLIDCVLVVDDGSTDMEVKSGLNWWKQDMGLPVSSLDIEKNIGFLLVANRGIRHIVDDENTKPEDIIILLSNDVKVNGQFIQQILDIFQDNYKSLVGGVLYSRDTGWNTFEGKIFPYLEGWLLATTAENWVELGYFDEMYSLNDMEDVDLSTTATQKGYQLVPLNNPVLQHLGAQTLGYNPERLKGTIINKMKFEGKWIK